MNQFLKKNLLYISVFITGACVLIIEVVAVRVLSPYYGNTIFTVSSVISVILTALSIGYYAGGKFADKHPRLQWFFVIILISGLVVLAFYFLSIIILPILSLSFSLISGPLVSSLFLFFGPAFLLGTLSPYAIKLQNLQVPQQGVGSVSGKVFFFSTLGSIIGSLVAGFLLIPNFGIDYIFITTGIVLFLMGFIPLIVLGFNKKRLLESVLIVLFLVSITVFSIQQVKGNVLYSIFINYKDGVYEKIIIYDNLEKDRPTRFFQQDRSSSGAMFLDTNDPTDLVYEYTKYYSLYKIFKPDVQNALVIGGGAYSIPKALLAELPKATVDVSEIEPSLFDLAKKYFKVPESPNLHNYIEDGRRFLYESKKKYDLIFSDVYYSLLSIPNHFTTQEFFTLLKDKLAEDGVFIANIIGDLSRQQPSFVFTEIKTFRSVFPNSYFFAVESPKKTDLQNMIFVGYNSDKKLDLNTSLILQNKNPIISLLPTKIINLNRFELSSYPILTDNFSPVEYLTAKALKRYFSKESFIDGNEILAVIDQLLRYGPRSVGSYGHKNVQDFLIAEMQEQAEEVKIQEWDYSALDGKTYQLKNIIARLYKNQEPRIILATHYDTKKFAAKDWSKKDQDIFEANNLASGVAILIELARILGNYHKIPNIGVDLVFFDGEEIEVSKDNDYNNLKPSGSTYFVNHLSEIYKNNKPIAAIVVDKVCDKDLKIYKEQSSVQNAKSQTDLFWSIAQKVNSRVFQNEVKQSVDNNHIPLNQAGIPSLLLINFKSQPDHIIDKMFFKCSAKGLEAIARAIFDYIYSY